MVCMCVCVCMCVLEVQQYMIWVYRYIAAFVSRYSDILYDTIKCELADEENFFLIYKFYKH